MPVAANGIMDMLCSTTSSSTAGAQTSTTAQGDTTKAQFQDVMLNILVQTAGDQKGESDRAGQQSTPVKTSSDALAKGKNGKTLRSKGTTQSDLGAVSAAANLVPGTQAIQQLKTNEKTDTAVAANASAAQTTESLPTVTVGAKSEKPKAVTTPTVDTSVKLPSLPTTAAGGEKTTAVAKPLPNDKVAGQKTESTASAGKPVQTEAANVEGRVNITAEASSTSVENGTSVAGKETVAQTGAESKVRPNADEPKAAQQPQKSTSAVAEQTQSAPEMAASVQQAESGKASTANPDTSDKPKETENVGNSGKSTASSSVTAAMASAKGKAAQHSGESTRRQGSDSGLGEQREQDASTAGSSTGNTQTSAFVMESTERAVHSDSERASSNASVKSTTGTASSVGSIHSAQNSAMNSTQAVISSAHASSQAQTTANDARILDTQRTSTVPVSEPTVSARMINQIVKAAKVQVVDGGTGMTLRLDPPHLGTVQMNVTSQHGSVTANLQTSNEAAKQLLESDLSSLKRSLSDAGINVDSINVSVGGNSTQSGNFNGGSQEYPESGRYSTFRFAQGSQTTESVTGTGWTAAQAGSTTLNFLA